MITLSKLHYIIIDEIINSGYAPDLDKLSSTLSSSNKEVEKKLFELQENHGIVLHPNSTKIWVAHPFSLAPTNFVIKSSKGLWWGNCAWCSLGVAALIKVDCTITSSFGGHGEQVILHVKNGKIKEDDLLIHFPIPMTKCWDNVIYSCSTMLIFKDENQIDRWSHLHNIPKGDVQSISNIWAFSKKWYGSHHSPDWKKWTKKEARKIFKEFGLNHKIWELDEKNGRF